jgi:hypothetical protein
MSQTVQPRLLSPRDKPPTATGSADEGQGVPQDDAVAASWYRKAADQGDAHSQLNLGLMYDKGQGVPQDHAAAVSWYRKAADQGDASAQFNLALMYDKGQGVPQDRAVAVVSKSGRPGRRQRGAPSASALRASAGGAPTTPSRSWCPSCRAVGDRWAVADRRRRPRRRSVCQRDRRTRAACASRDHCVRAATPRSKIT